LSDYFSRVQPDTADVEMERDDDDFKAEFDITGDQRNTQNTNGN